MKGSIMKQLILPALGFGVMIVPGIGLKRANTSPDSPLNTARAVTRRNPSFNFLRPWLCSLP
jgi:hypothetical protein